MDCQVCNGKGIVGWIESEPESGITTLEQAECDNCNGTGKPPAPMMKNEKEGIYGD